MTLVEELKVGQVFISKQEETCKNYEIFLRLVKEKNLKVQEIKAGDKMMIEGITFQILWPIEQQIEENKLNNNAIVMKLQYNNFSMLFVGDIEEIAERAILDTYRNHLEVLSATVLKVAHHGSKSSTIKEFLEVVNSKVAVIGVGKHNIFGHPSNEVLQRLKLFGMQVFRTDEDGEIIIQTNGKQIKINSFLNH